MNENTLNNFAHSANLKKIVIYGGIMVLTCLAIIFYLTNAVMYLEVKNNTDTSVTTAAIIGAEIKPVGSSGLIIVPRAATGLIISAGDKALTQTNIDLPWFGVPSKSVQLNAGSKAKQVSYRGAEPICTTYAQPIDVLLRYDCVALNKLLVSEMDSSGKVADKKVAEMQYVAGQTLLPYRNGVLGIAESSVSSGVHGDRKALVRFTSSKGTVSYDAPDQVTTSTLQGLRIFTDTNNTENGRFILVDIFGVIYLGTPSEDGKSVNYKEVEAPSNYSYKFNQTLCTIRDEVAYCYRGQRDTDIEDGAVVAEPSVVQLSFTGGETNSRVLKGLSIADGFYATSSGLYLKNKSALYALKVLSSEYETMKLAQFVERVITGNKLYFVKSNGVHELDDKTYDSHRIFYSPEISVRGFYPAGGKLFVFGQTRASGNTVFAYQLN